VCKRVARKFKYRVKGPEGSEPSQATARDGARAEVVEKRQFTMADLLPTEAPCQFGVEPAGRNAGSSLTARLPAGREWKG